MTFAMGGVPHTGSRQVGKSQRSPKKDGLGFRAQALALALRGMPVLFRWEGKKKMVQMEMGDQVGRCYQSS